jgi:hypothetical protein
MANTKSEAISQAAIEKRFTAALGRALTTPHKPQAAQPKGKKKKPSR